MTLEAQPSTSSAGTDGSKQYVEVVKLGMRIVQELGLDDSVDTLGRWIAHRIAELIERSQHLRTKMEREDAKRECTDLVLRVWERRKYWPHGQPLGELSTFIESLTREPYPSPMGRGVPEILSWIEALPLIDHLSHREHEILRDAAIADLHLEKDRKWLEENPQRLSAEERDIIIELLRRQEALKESYYKLDDRSVPNFGSLPLPERRRLVLEALNGITENRQKVFDAIRKSVEKARKDATRVARKKKLRRAAAKRGRRSGKL
jgi:hypothetical protein